MGSQNSEWDDLECYAEQDGDLMIQQIHAIAPRIVVCGGIWELVQGCFEGAECDCGEGCREEEGCYFGVYKYEAGKSRMMHIIDFWHPSSRYPKYLSDLALAEALRRALRRDR